VDVQENDSSVTITSPSDGEIVTGSDVTVSYSITGSAFDHLHLSLDGAGHVTISDLSGTYTFPSVSNGSHTVTAQLVDANHQPVAGSDTHDSVTFTVDASGSSGGVIDLGQCDSLDPSECVVTLFGGQDGLNDVYAWFASTGF